MINSGIIGARHRSFVFFKKLQKLNADRIQYYSPSDEWVTAGDIDFEMNLSFRSLDSTQIAFSYYRTSDNRFELFFNGTDLAAQITCQATVVSNVTQTISLNTIVNVKVNNSKVYYDDVEILDFSANAGLLLQNVSDVFMVGTRPTNFGFASNCDVYSFRINNNTFNCQEASGFPVLGSVIGKDANGQTDNAGLEVYWNEFVIQKKY
jgi:hypothetical protein